MTERERFWLGVLIQLAPRILAIVLIVAIAAGLGLFA